MIIMNVIKSFFVCFIDVIGVWVCFDCIINMFGLVFFFINIYEFFLVIWKLNLGYYLISEL